MFYRLVFTLKICWFVPESISYKFNSNDVIIISIKGGSILITFGLFSVNSSFIWSNSTHSTSLFNLYFFVNYTENYIDGDVVSTANRVYFVNDEREQNFDYD